MQYNIYLLSFNNPCFNNRQSGFTIFNIQDVIVNPSFQKKGIGKKLWNILVKMFMMAQM